MVGGLADLGLYYRRIADFGHVLLRFDGFPIKKGALRFLQIIEMNCMTHETGKKCL